MRRFLIPFSILTILLTACGTFEVTLLSGREPTPAAASLTPAGRAALNMDSTSEEIRTLLLESPSQWRTLFMDAQVTAPGEPPRRVQVWVDQPALSLRVLGGPPEGPAQTLRLVDGQTLLDLNIQTGESSLSPFSAAEGEPHPLFMSVDRALSTPIFPSAIAANEGTFKPVGMEVVAYRLALIVEWTYSQNDLPSYRAWVDVSTGVFLRYQQFEKGGGTDILSEVTASRVDYDLLFPSDLFSPALAAMPDFASGPLSASSAVVTPAAPFEGEDPLGWVYSFVADNGYPVRRMRLARLPASCAVGKAECPQVEIIPMPVELTSSLQPLVWSPARREAAWVYPLDAEQRIWTLYLFDAGGNSWKELVQMERYLDPPMWSRDGEWLAFRAQDGKGGEDIFAVRRDGSGLKNLTASESLPAEGRPYVMDTWLGGSVLLRSAKPGGTGTVYRLRVEDGFVEPLFETLRTKSPLLESPDGTMLAYVDYSYDNPRQLVRIMTPNGQVLRDLATFVSGSILNLTWSPDGTQIGFVHLTDDASSVYVIGSDGRGLRQAYVSKTDAHFVFSPDGKYLLVQTIDGTGEHLYAVDLSTLQARLVQVPGVALNESWMWPGWIAH